MRILQRFVFTSNGDQIIMQLVGECESSEEETRQTTEQREKTRKNVA